MKDIDFDTRAIALKNKMIELNIAEPNLVSGCSKEEIEKLEQDNNVIFPKSYRVFLEYFGHGLGGTVMSDINILYEDIQGLTDRLRNEVLIYEGDPILPENAFVFATRFEEQFMFFDVSSSQDEPPILYYMENHESFSQVGKSIFDILEKEIEGWYQLKMESEERKRNRNNRQISGV